MISSTPPRIGTAPDFTLLEVSPPVPSVSAAVAGVNVATAVSGSVTVCTAVFVPSDARSSLSSTHTAAVTSGKNEHDTVSTMVNAPSGIVSACTKLDASSAKATARRTVAMKTIGHYEEKQKFRTCSNRRIEEHEPRPEDRWRCGRGGGGPDGHPLLNVCREPVSARGDGDDCGGQNRRRQPGEYRRLDNRLIDGDLR